MAPRPTDRRCIFVPGDDRGTVLGAVWPPDAAVLPNVPQPGDVERIVDRLATGHGDFECRLGSLAGAAR